MKINDKISDSKPRNWIALITLLISILAITVFTIIIILKESDESQNIFNIIFPVYASWVGTILAFYFGRENFESANRQIESTNKQINEFVRRLSPEERAEAKVKSVMRTFENIVYLQIESGKRDRDFKISELSSKFVNNISRLPVINDKVRPKYMIHSSSINKYIVSGGKPDDTLEQFILEQKKDGLEYGLNKGFIIVSEQDTLKDAKRKLEETHPCLDIFITKNGIPDEPLTGWISNIRLTKYLEA